MADDNRLTGIYFDPREMSPRKKNQAIYMNSPTKKEVHDLVVKFNASPESKTNLEKKEDDDEVVSNIMKNNLMDIRKTKKNTLIKSLTEKETEGQINCEKCIVT